ncbi:MAG: FAD-binding oxidoreductase, partial [Gemmatimonadetes bacterium]|nr:FAD-binding oxidoreductase [Gemmatimonadota bacterium]
MTVHAARILADVLPAGALPGADAREVWALGGCLPQAVAEPGTVEEIQAVLAAARAGGFAVVPMGGVTDPGAEAPRGPFVVLSTRRLAGVDDYRPSDLTVTARAGTTLATLGSTLAERGQWLPVDPPFAPRKSLGGLVATGAAGSLGMAYGTPRDHVLGLSVVTGDGRLLSLGGRVMKNVAGFDLVKLMVGSRGTLGIITSATLRLFPRPAEDRAVVLRGEGVGALLE